MTTEANPFLIDDVRESVALREGAIVLRGSRAIDREDDPDEPEDERRYGGLSEEEEEEEFDFDDERYRPQAPNRPSREDERDDEEESLLPAIIEAQYLLDNVRIQPPGEIVRGVLHRGMKAVVAGPSKTHKTWVLLDLALSVAGGRDWWGWPTTRSRVLFVNFELHDPFMKSRLGALMEAKAITRAENLDVWNLRGHAAPFDELLPKMQKAMNEKEYGLIILDPVYKALAGMDENKASDINILCNALEDLAQATGATVVYAHHFAKGNSAGKESIDRMSGSGVFARDADTIITLSPHEGERAFTVDLTLRNFAEHPSFVVEWDYPLMARNDDLDPKDLRGRAGAPKKLTPDQALGLLREGPLRAGDWQKAVCDTFNVSKSSFDRVRKELNENKKIEKTQDKKWQRRVAGPDSNKAKPQTRAPTATLSKEPTKARSTKSPAKGHAKQKGSQSGK